MKRQGFISLTVMAIIAIAVLFLLWMCLRSCNKIIHPKQPRTVTDSFSVIQADSGASLLVGKVGKRRNRGERKVILEGIEAPAGPVDGPLAEASRSNLERLAGDTVVVTWQRHGPLRSEADASRQDGRAEADEVLSDGGKGVEARGPKLVTCEACGGKGWCLPPQEWINSHPEDKDRHDQCWACGGSGELVQESSEPVEDRSPIIGVAVSSGVTLNLAQVEAGMAKCAADAPKDWKAAEKVAKKQKLGMWGKQ